MRYFLPTLALLASLAGCTLIKQQQEKTAQAPTGSKKVPVEQQLADTAKAIEKSLHTLAAQEEQKSPPVIKTAALVTEQGGMGGYADIEWTGPIEPLIRKLATMTHYRVKVLGNEPSIPILVSITAKKVQIADILQNASLQAGRRIHLVVFPQEKTIELRYMGS